MTLAGEADSHNAGRLSGSGYYSFLFISFFSLLVSSPFSFLIFLIPVHHILHFASDNYILLHAAYSVTRVVRISLQIIYS
jgi:hypothetical protein